MYILLVALAPAGISSWGPSVASPLSLLSTSARSDSRMCRSPKATHGKAMHRKAQQSKAL